MIKEGGEEIEKQSLLKGEKEKEGNLLLKKRVRGEEGEEEKNGEEEEREEEEEEGGEEEEEEGGGEAKKKRHSMPRSCVRPNTTSTKRLSSRISNLTTCAKAPLA